MRNSIYIFICVFFFIACNKENDPIPTPPIPIKEMGSLDITLKFTHDHNLGYTLSTARPLTTWAGNILDMLMILSDASNIIRYAVPVSLSTSTNNSAETRSFSNIPVGTYTVTIVANAGQSNILTLGYSGGWTPANIVGQNLNTLVLNTTTDPSYVPVSGETGYTGYQSPAEIFTATQSSVTISADATTTVASPFVLTRIISLLRVRIDQSKSGNTVISFTNAAANLRIRNIATSYNLATGVNTSVSNNNLIYVDPPGVFKNTEPASGYTAGNLLDVPNKITLWCDVVLFPGGSASVAASKFQVVICGLAPIGYKPLGALFGLTVATPVYWSGTPSAAVLSNNIMEVNCTLNSKGSTTIP